MEKHDKVGEEVQGLTVLSIEPAIAGGSLAVVRSGTVLDSWTGTDRDLRAESILPSVDSLLRRTPLKAVDLDLIRVSLGPGSFTGLRVGIATAAGLARSLGVRVEGIPLFGAMASRSRSLNSVIAVPIGRSDVGFQVFESGSAVAEPESVEQARFVAYLESTLKPIELVSPALLAQRLPLSEISAVSLCIIDNLAEALALFPSSAKAGLNPIYVASPRLR